MYISAPNNIAEILLKLTLNSNQSINHVYLDLFTLIILNLNDSSLYCAIRPIYNIHSISPPPQKKINTQIQQKFCSCSNKQKRWTEDINWS